MNPYEVLGVESDATAARIKGVYRQLAAKYHPDHNEGFEDKFREVEAAYSILKDPDKRAYYDEHGNEGPPVIPTITPAQTIVMEVLDPALGVTDEDMFQFMRNAINARLKQARDIVDCYTSTATLTRQKLELVEAYNAPDGRTAFITGGIEALRKQYEKFVESKRQEIQDCTAALELIDGLRCPAVEKKSPQRKTSRGINIFTGSVL